MHQIVHCKDEKVILKFGAMSILIENENKDLFAYRRHHLSEADG